MNPFKTRPDETLCYALAILFGGLTGYVEIRSGALLLPVMLLLVFGGLLGLAQPRRAGENALLLGLCIPVAHLLAALVDYPYEVISFHSTFVALIPAFIGAYTGAFIGWLAERREEER
ncbi:MAG: hypothetical protein AUG51_20670 [Acidobacteria bacterium 13_1_20CM_3_53_8]|nr:MAG: hypothetical protein AUG51_20670 [Acidobacteria bacterium 13_1_20CM_3_53_8]